MAKKFDLALWKSAVKELREGERVNLTYSYGNAVPIALRLKVVQTPTEADKQEGRFEACVIAEASGDVKNQTRSTFSYGMFEMDGMVVVSFGTTTVFDPVAHFKAYSAPLHAMNIDSWLDLHAANAEQVKVWRDRMCDAFGVPPLPGHELCAVSNQSVLEGKSEAVRLRAALLVTAFGMWSYACSAEGNSVTAFVTFGGAGFLSQLGMHMLKEEAGSDHKKAKSMLRKFSDAVETPTPDRNFWLAFEAARRAAP